MKWFSSRHAVLIFVLGIFVVCVEHLHAGQTAVLSCPSTLGFLSKLRFHSRDEPNLNKSNIVHAYSDLIENLPDQSLQNILAANDPFHLPRAGDLETFEIVRGLKFLSRIISRDSGLDGELKVDLINSVRSVAAKRGLVSERARKAQKKIIGVNFRILHDFSDRKIIGAPYLFLAGNKAALLSQDSLSVVLKDLVNQNEISFLPGDKFSFQGHKAISSVRDWWVQDLPFETPNGEKVRALFTVNLSTGSLERLDGSDISHPSDLVSSEDGETMIRMSEKDLRQYGTELVFQKWNIRTRTLLTEFIKFTGKLGKNRHISISNDKHWIATFDSKNNITLWDAVTHTCDEVIVYPDFQGEFPVRNKPLISLFSPDSYKLLVSGYRSLAVYQRGEESLWFGPYKSTKPIFKHHFGQERVIDSFFGRDSKQLYVLLKNRSADSIYMEIFDLRWPESPAQPKNTIRIQEVVDTRSLVFTARHIANDGRILLAIGIDSKVYVIDPNDIELRIKPIFLPSPPTELFFNGDGRQIAIQMTNNGGMIYEIDGEDPR